MLLKRKIKIVLIWLLVGSWVFGYPPFYENLQINIQQKFLFPPKIQRALAAVPTYFNSGNFTNSATTCTAPFPASTQADDIAILVAESENQAISLTTANGFVALGTQANTAAGTAATDPANRIAIYWKRLAGGDSAPVLADSGDHTTCQIHVFRGVITGVDPWDVLAEGNDSGANDTSGVIPGNTTTVENALVVLIQGTSLNGNSSAECSNWTNINLANLTERTDNSNTRNLGGGHCVATGEKSSVGNYGNTTVTMANTTYKGAISIALKPAPSTITVGTTGNQTSSMLIPSTNQYVGGAFTFVRNETTANVTSIVISETGTVNANSNLSNVQLYYKQEATCSASIPGDATVFNSTGVSFDASENATVTGTMAVGTSQICVYVELDVGSGASNGQTLEIEITDPSTEVTVSAGVASPATAVAISGQTNLNLAPNVFIDHYRWRNDNGPQGNQPQTLYFNPTGNGFGSVDFTVNAGCSAGSEWDCVDDGSADTQSSAPTSDTTTSELQFAAATDYYTLANDALLSGSTITQLDITASGLRDTGNPNAAITLGYCIVGGSNDCGTNDTMGTQQAFSTTITQQFTGLSLSTTDLNNVQLVVDSSRATAAFSTLYVLITYSVPEATWATGAEDQVLTNLSKNSNIRLRFQADNIGGSASNYNYRLEWAVQSGGSCEYSGGGESYSAVPDTATTEHFDMVTSNAPGYVDGEPTTAKLSNGEAYTFVAGTTVESTSNQSGAITLAQNQYTEVEYAFQANSNATDGGVYCFRVTNAGTALNSADVIAQVTLSSGGGGTLTTDIVDSGGSPVGSPTVSMTQVFFDPFASSTASGIFSVSDQKIRVTNTTGNAAWSLTIAPTGGATDFWDGTTADYDYNDPLANLVVDNDFNASADSADLRSNGGGQDWYESRNDLPTLITLNTADYGGNSSKKAHFASSTTNNAYLSQQFSAAVEGFTANWDIYVDDILDNLSNDRGAAMMIGYDDGVSNGPNSAQSERFLLMSFYKLNGGDTGTANLLAMETGDTFSDSSTWRTVASGLNLDQWYNIRVDGNVRAGTYSVYVDGSLTDSGVDSLSTISTAEYISFGTWNDTRGAFLVDDVYVEKTDGTDADTLGGQMTLDPSGGTITPQGGCSVTGLSKGSLSTFLQGTTDNITLLTAGGSAETGCYWDFTGIDILQTIPKSQAADTYSIDMTLTITAS